MSILDDDIHNNRDKKIESVRIFLYYRQVTMANAANSIEKEWATSLLGLRMQVPGFWWHNSWGNIG